MIDWKPLTPSGNKKMNNEYWTEDRIADLKEDARRQSKRNNGLQIAVLSDGAVDDWEAMQKRPKFYFFRGEEITKKEFETIVEHIAFW